MEEDFIKKDIEDIKKYLEYSAGVISDTIKYEEYLAEHLNTVIDENIKLKEIIKDLVSRIEKLES